MLVPALAHAFFIYDKRTCYPNNCDIVPLHHAYHVVHVNVLTMMSCKWVTEFLGILIMTHTTFKNVPGAVKILSKQCVKFHVSNKVVQS